MRTLRDARRPLMMLTLAIATGGALSGCVTYYRVTDRESGKTYYTNNMLSDFRPVSNSVHLVDPRDWQGRLLMSPDVEKIPAKEYRAAVTKQDIKNDMNWWW
ncbi:MAG: hypothetical protein KF684_08220 [Phycisphaeraceae bacterium]|nr:hypothetical protein [Phycisphaeraceae bacterium]